MEPETLPRHELVGLRVEVVDAADAALVGLAGRVVDETMQTLLVAPDDGDGEPRDRGASRVKQVQKAAATFAFTLPDDDATRVVVDGERLVARPARRTEQRGDSIWR